MGFFKALFGKPETKQPVKNEVSPQPVKKEVSPQPVNMKVEKAEVKAENSFVNNPKPYGDDSLAHITRSLEIKASREAVWNLITDSGRWNDWYGATINSINPGWEKEAKIVWQLGSPSRIGEFRPLEEISLVGGVGTWITLRISQVSEGRISVSMTEDRRTGLTMEGAFMRHREMDTVLGNMRNLLEADGTFRWKVRLEDGGDTGSTYGPFKIGHLLIAVTGNKLHAVDMNGNMKWTYSPGWGCNPRSPIACHGRVIFNDLKNKVLCLDADTGSKLWESSPGGESDQPPAYDGNRVFQTNRDGKMFALSGEDGKTLWSVEQENRLSSPVIADGRLYAIGTGFVKALDIENGSAIWKTNLNTMSFTMPFLLDDRVYVSTKMGFDILDAQTGEILSTFDFYKGDKSGPAVLDGKAYFRTDNHGICCVDCLSGTVVWQYTVDTKYSDYVGTREIPAIASGCVCCNPGDSHVYCIDMETGQPLWSQPVNCTDSFIIESDCVYYLSSRSLCAREK